VRTNLTLDDDVKAKLDQVVRKGGKSFNEVVNDMLRLGLALARTKPVTPFVIQARPLGLPAGLSYDNIEELIDQLEGRLRK
jgi:hypothetical protein